MKAKLGSGKRFKALKNKLAHQKGVTNPEKLAAYIGIVKYGKARMMKMAKAGKNRRG